jgi:hypothetical protein
MLTQHFNGTPVHSLSELEEEIGWEKTNRFNEDQIFGIVKEQVAGCVGQRRSNKGTVKTVSPWAGLLTISFITNEVRV